MAKDDKEKKKPFSLAGAPEHRESAKHAHARVSGDSSMTGKLLRVVLGEHAGLPPEAKKPSKTEVAKPDAHDTPTTPPHAEDKKESKDVTVEKKEEKKDVHVEKKEEKAESHKEEHGKGH